MFVNMFLYEITYFFFCKEALPFDSVWYRIKKRGFFWPHILHKGGSL